MKITFVSLWACKLFRQDEPQPFGGAELQMYLLAKALARRHDVEVQFVTRGAGKFEIFDYQGIRVYKLPFHASHRARMLFGTIDLIRLCLRLDTGVFLQRAGGIETGIVAGCARLKKRKFVFMTSSLRDTDGTRQRLLGPLWGWIYSFGLRQSTTIVTQTTEQQEAMQRVHGLNSIALRSAHEIPEEIPPHKSGILWVGRCEKAKRPDILLQLAQDFPALLFTMVCPKANYPDLFTEIRERAASLPNLTFYETLPFEQTEALFARHQLYLNTSEHEGFPNTFVQAFKWGTPVISLFVDPDQCLTRNNMGFCAQGDIHALKNEILKLSAPDSEKWKILQQNGRLYAQEQHDINIIAEKFLKLIKSSLEQTGG
ncbi:MAG: glycosyltransferase family 4 protein [bacterium]|jgi:glycosyltransferase involved in cell wall biosynthesis